MDFSITLATPADDPAIRQLLADNPMPGALSLSYRREPDYFYGCETMGPFCQVPIARHRSSGRLAGIICRSSRLLFVNGQPQEVGYLSQLRIDAKFQGRWLAPQGHRYLRQLHADGRVTGGYLASIIEDNARAIGLLVKHPRRGYPALRQVCRLWTLALIVRRPKPVHLSPYAISRGTSAELEETAAFLRQHGSKKQFFPVYSAADFAGNPITRDFQVEDFFLARCNGKLVGTMGLWDQSAYKQVAVHGYSRTMALLRPLCNLGMRILGAQPLPLPGQHIRFAYASFICTEGNNPEIFKVLLAQVYNHVREREYAYLMLGFAASDSLLKPARSYLHIPYRSLLYTVCWDDAADWHSKLDNRVPYVEIAAL